MSTSKAISTNAALRRGRIHRRAETALGCCLFLGPPPPSVGGRQRRSQFPQRTEQNDAHITLSQAGQTGDFAVRYEGRKLQGNQVPLTLVQRTQGLAQLLSRFP